MYVVEADDDQAADGDRGDRDKRKVGVVKLGISNGIINFVFGVRDTLANEFSFYIIFVHNSHHHQRYFSHRGPVSEAGFLPRLENQSLVSTGPIE